AAPPPGGEGPGISRPLGEVAYGPEVCHLAVHNALASVARGGARVDPHHAPDRGVIGPPPSTRWSTPRRLVGLAPSPPGKRLRFVADESRPGTVARPRSHPSGRAGPGSEPGPPGSPEGTPGWCCSPRSGGRSAGASRR